MQIYKHMDIGTAKATEAERKAVPHHLIDFLSPDIPYSASDYASDAYEAAKKIIKNKKPSIIYARLLLNARYRPC